MRWSSRCCLALALSLFAPVAGAFDQAGHFYTAYALTWTAGTGRSSADRLLVSFCAQLPDMAADIDATRVYRRAFTWHPIDWANWAQDDIAEAPAVRKMVTVQHLLHGLTGGNAHAVQQVARASTARLRAAYRPGDPVPELAVQLCAWGFSLHFLGDSLAHENIQHTAYPRAARTRTMYGTGFGHAFDGHLPDYVLCAGYVPLMGEAKICEFSRNPELRFAAWEALLRDEARSTFDPDGTISANAAQQRQRLIQAVIELGSKDATARNHWGEEKMRKELLSPHESVQQIQDFIKRFDGSSRGCESVLREALSTLAALQPYAGLTCDAVWRVYQKSVRAEFDAPANAAARREFKHRQAFDSLYVESPLDRE